MNFQPIKRKKEGEEKKMTQEEMLLEAAQTGFYSQYSVLGDDLRIAGNFLFICYEFVKLLLSV